VTSAADEGEGVWGGVLAQLAVFGPCLLMVSFGRSLADAAPAFVNQLLLAGVWLNPLLLVLNLLPFGGLDGARAWSIVPLLAGRLRPRSKGRRALPREPERPTNAPEGDGPRTLH